jgi:hypothetical protein
MTLEIIGAVFVVLWFGYFIYDFAISPMREELERKKRQTPAMVKAYKKPLVAIIEGRWQRKEILDWWQKKQEKLKLDLPYGWFVKLNSAMQDATHLDELRFMHRLQLAIQFILDKQNIPYRFNDKFRAKLQLEKEAAWAEEDQPGMGDEDVQLECVRLRKHFPKLSTYLLQNLEGIFNTEVGLSDEELSDSEEDNNCKYPPSLRHFLLHFSGLDVEDETTTNTLALGGRCLFLWEGPVINNTTNRWLKIGEYNEFADGDSLLIDANDSGTESPIFLLDHHSGKTEKLADSLFVFLENYSQRQASIAEE